jgi:mercuric reductase
MSQKVDKALLHLQSILPLKSHQDNCSKESKRLHQAILRSFIEKGRVLNTNEMKPLTSNVVASLISLQEQDLVVLDTNHHIIGAYPLTMEKREHKIQVDKFLLHAMCALDALSVSSLFQVDTVISSVCRVTQSKIHIKQSNGLVQNMKQASDIHVGIAWSAASTDSCCANNLCMEMLFLINTPVAQQWLADDENGREIFALADSVEFGGLFFNPLLAD